jgi:hypothetical protein
MKILGCCHYYREFVMRRLLYLCVGASALFSSPFIVADEAYTCRHNGLERTIKVSYEINDSQIPCKVVYEKDSGTQILWSSENEAGYCEAKVASFVERQRGWGWNCTELAVTAPRQ